VSEAATSARDAAIDQSLKRLSTAWQEGEARPTHRRALKPKRRWQTRKDPVATSLPAMIPSVLMTKGEQLARVILT
jgi:hypothetical protein